MLFHFKHTDIDSGSSDYDMRLKRLKAKHGRDLQEFKLRVWAKMTVMYCQVN